MLRIGYHVSAAGGYTAMVRRATALGANTFAFFTRNPRGGAGRYNSRMALPPFLFPTGLICFCWCEYSTKFPLGQ